MQFHVADMTCQHCARAITRAIHAVAPGAAVDVDVLGKTVTVQSDAQQTTLQDAMAEAGYTAVPASGPSASGGGCCGTCHG